MPTHPRPPTCARSWPTPSPRVRDLRPLDESDAHQLYQLIAANRDHLAPWLPWTAARRSRGPSSTSGCSVGRRRRMTASRPESCSRTRDRRDGRLPQRELATRVHQHRLLAGRGPPGRRADDTRRPHAGEPRVRRVGSPPRGNPGRGRQSPQPSDPRAARLPRGGRSKRGGADRRALQRSAVYAMLAPEWVQEKT